MNNNKRERREKRPKKLKRKDIMDNILYIERILNYVTLASINREHKSSKQKKF